MNESYEDIRERIAEEPTWYDENGVPRYGKFVPDRCPDIYADQVVLLHISCQACGQRFDVQMSGGWMCHINNPMELHYGDPPFHDCVGDTMNCEDIAVLEVWTRNMNVDMGEWKRHPEKEGIIK